MTFLNTTANTTRVEIIIPKHGNKDYQISALIFDKNMSKDDDEKYIIPALLSNIQ